MSGFSAEWLALRESFDVRARNPAVLDAVIALLQAKRDVRLVDLACGTGSTLRSLGPRLSARQHWNLLDNDERLLKAASSGHASGTLEVNAVQLDINGDFESALARATDLVTTSALLDLVSETWLDRLARHAAAHALPVYAALSYDGRITLSPDDATDAAIVAAVNAHQNTDKGFGPALGPAAATAAISRFEALGYSVVEGQSDWMIDSADQKIQIELLDGWAGAAHEMQMLPNHEIDSWLVRRKGAVDQRASTMRVGHVDFLAAPRTTR